jgi:ribonuclease P protein component
MKSGGAGFSATRRLRLRADLVRVYRSGQVNNGSLFSSYTLPREGEGRLGILVSRRWGTAVERNRMKRLFREAFRRHPEEFAGVDLIVRPHESCKGLRAKEIERALMEGFHTAISTEVKGE